MKKYFISFIEEAVFNEDYKGFIGGRIEVYDNKNENPYSEEEIRFFTSKRKEFYNFREKWDFKDITKEELRKVKKITKERFYQE